MLSEYRNYPAATEMLNDLAGNYLNTHPSGVADRPLKVCRSKFRGSEAIERGDNTLGF